VVSELIDHEDETDHRPTATVALVIDMEVLGRQPWPQCPRVHRTQLERSADDVTTSLENWRMQVQAVELWAAIDKISDSSRRTSYLDIIDNGSAYSCVVSGTQLSEVIYWYRARNDGKANLI
jgi:hypothetical protein